MEEWINPQYAELVAAYRWQQVEEPDEPPIGVNPKGSAGPAVRGFVMDRLD
ncbi:hypothetical protein [Kitasatospora sp. LaBMicrA B282]|uniref:hypothetical protein n=1 Tax=Kitasatospora sp. LaBMicrA B282 TaxID=3420949 RepID=UPI003D107053